MPPTPPASPLPWRAESRSYQTKDDTNWWRCTVSDANGTTVAFGLSRDKAVAVLIGREIASRHNAHAALVEVAKLLGDRDCEHLYDEEPCLPCMARAALAGEGA